MKINLHHGYNPDLCSSRARPLLHHLTFKPFFLDNGDPMLEADIFSDLWLLISVLWNGFWPLSSDLWIHSFGDTLEPRYIFGAEPLDQ